MYTLLELKSKTFGELKKIGYELNVLPPGDRRCRQSWIDAIAGVNPPLLALLEVSPAGEVPAQEPIAPVAENPPGVEVETIQEAPMESKFCRMESKFGRIESKFGRIVYPKQAAKPIAQNEEARPQLDRAQSADVHNRGSHPTKSDRDSSGAKTEALGSQEGDQVLAVARHCETGRGRVLPDQSTKLVNFTEADRLENEPRMSQSAIGLGTENSPGVKVDPRQEPIEPVAKTSAAKVSSSKKVKANFYLDCPSCGIGRLRVKQSIYWETSCTKCGYFAESTLYPFTPADTGYKVGDWVKLRIKPRLATNISRGEVVCIEKVYDDYLRFVNPNLNPALVLWARRQLLHPHEVSPCEPPVVKAAETSPGVKTQATAIAPVAKNYLEEKSDLNPILTGIVLSDRFVARYSPPQAEIVHFHSDADGQLSLINFQVVTESEPPDPDDFESLDAFREAIARWDAQNPEPPAVSIASMCEWAPCPEEWYEPKAEILPLKASSMIELPEQSEVMELSITACSSITSDFFIPTFGRLGDRSNRSDEPPDTGIFARLPKPKPPTFPPQASQPKSAQVSPSQASRNYPETIPKLFHRVFAGSTLQARSPPGGDAGF
jgi:hypothetical protein